MNVCMCINVRVCTYVLSAYIGRYVRTYIRACVRAYVRTYLPTYMSTYIRTYICTFARMYVRTYVRLYVHTYNKLTLVIINILFIPRIMASPTNRAVQYKWLYINLLSPLFRDNRHLLSVQKRAAWRQAR